MTSPKIKEQLMAPRVWLRVDDVRWMPVYVAPQPPGFASDDTRWVFADGSTRERRPTDVITMDVPRG